MVFGQQQSSELAHVLFFHSDHQQSTYHANEIDPGGFAETDPHEHPISLHLKDLGSTVSLPAVHRQPEPLIVWQTPRKLIGSHAQIFRPPRL